jgi:hypothetical protein
LTPSASPSIALSSQRGVSCTLFLNRITLCIVRSSGIIWLMHNCCFALKLATPIA